MPVPQKSDLESLVKGMMQSEGLRGDGAPKLASAIADIVAQALGLLAQQAQVAPGIACTPAATAAPGRVI
jgi:hypothetical protein